MSNVNFITGNPAIDGFQQQQRHLEQQRASEMQNRRAALELAEYEALQANRMRGSDLDLQSKEIGVNQSRLNYDTALQTQGNDIALSGQRVRAGEQGLRQGDLRLQGDEAAEEMRAFDTAIQYIKTGDIQAAEQISRRFAKTPEDNQVLDTIFKNANNATALARIYDEAAQRYSGNPALRAEYVQKGIAQILGENPTLDRTDPTAPHKVEGAPPIPTQDLSGKEYNGEKRWIAERMRAGGYNEEQIMAAILGNKPPTELELRELARKQVATMYPSSDWSTKPADRQAAFDTELKALRTAFGTPAPAAPTTDAPDMDAAPGTPAVNTPAPAARPGASGAPQTMGGAGTEAEPFQPQSQADVDWFKENAPAGSVIAIPNGNGGFELYGK